MNKIYKSFSIVTLVAIITRTLSFVFKIYLSRKIGAEILGLYQITISIFILISCLSSSGLPVTISRITAECCSIGNVKKLNSVFTSGLILSIILTCLPICLILFFPSMLSLIFSDNRCITLLYIMLPMLITCALYSTLRSWFWGKKEFNVFAISELIDEITKILISIILFSFVAGKLVDSIYIYAIAMLIGDIIVITYLIVSFKIKGGHFGEPKYFSEISKSSVPITTSRLLAAILSSFLSIMIPSLLMSDYGLTLSEANAEYGRASGMVMSLVFAPNAILSSLSVILIPEIASLCAKKDQKQITQKLNKSILISVIITSFFFIFFSGIGQEIGEILYSDKLVGKYLTFACIMMIPNGINGIITSMLNSMKKEINTFYSYIISSIFLIAIVYLTPKYIGIYAYFLSLIVFHFINMIINLFSISKYVVLKATTLYSSIGIIGISSFIALLLQFIMKKLSFSIIINIVICVSLGIALIAIFSIPFYLYFFRKNPQNVIR